MKHVLCVWLLLVLGVVSHAASVPPDWAPRIKAGNMIYSPTDILEDPFLLPVVANGYVGTIIASQYMYVGGVFNGGNTTSLNGPTHRAAIPSTVAISITNAATYATAIDLEYGIYYRRSTAGPYVSIEQRWFAHREIPHLLVHEIDINNTYKSSLELYLSLNQTKSPDFVFESSSTNETIAFNGTTLITPLAGGQPTHIAVMATAVPWLLTSLPLKNLNFQFVTAISTSLDSDEPVESVAEIYKQYWNSSLMPSHIEAWQTFWESGIEIEGDPYLAAAVNNSLYEILSNIRTDWPYSLSPGGISTNGYNGHTFWDTETWMYPTLLLLYPDIARGLLQYRYDRIPAGMDNARAMGYQGVKYPWESALSGLEVILYPPNQEGRLEVHINGDVARAIAQYFFVSNDLAWLNSTGFPMLNGIAEYWVSRVEFNNSIGQYVINGVQCPDESAINVNNSVYTNTVAGLSLLHATQFASLLGVSPPPSWLKIANNIKIPFDVQLQWHPEYDGYNGETINQADVALLQYPLGIAMSREVAVNDLLYYQNHTDRNGMFTGDWHVPSPLLLPIPYVLKMPKYLVPQVRRKFGEKTSFRFSYSIAWLRLGNPDNAEYYFNNTLQHLKPPFMVFTERIVGGIPHFITGAGGFLQNIVFGYLGLQIEDSNITVNPSFLPPAPSTATQITVRKFQYLGNFVTLSFNATHITFTNDGPTYKSTRSQTGSNAFSFFGSTMPQLGKQSTAASALVIIDQQNNTWTFNSGSSPLVFAIGKYTIMPLSSH